MDTTPETPRTRAIRLLSRLVPHDAHNEIAEIVDSIIEAAREAQRSDHAQAVDNFRAGHRV